MFVPDQQIFTSKEYGGTLRRLQLLLLNSQKRDQIEGWNEKTYFYAYYNDPVIISNNLYHKKSNGSQ